MRISLIGMSNIGKTYWSKQLEKHGYLRFSCDDYIEEKLKKELAILGYRGFEEISKWLGQPYDKQYPEASKKYLKLERQSLLEIFQRLDKLNGENIVIDTTGSVINHDEEILRQLGKYTLVVYLDTPSPVKREMYKSYLNNPKPVIWGEHFNFIKGESPMKALSRCYPRLLDYRTKQYQKFADIHLNYFLLRSRNFTVENFLTLLNQLEDKA